MIRHIWNCSDTFFCHQLHRLVRRILFWTRKKITVAEAEVEYPDEWRVRAPDITTSPLEDDNAFYVGLMNLMFEKGWQLSNDEWSSSVKREMEKLPEYWDRYREFLQRRILLVATYRKQSLLVWKFWWKKYVNRELQASITESYLMWNLMPMQEREKFPDLIFKNYRRLISKDNLRRTNKPSPRSNAFQTAEA